MAAGIASPALTTCARIAPAADAAFAAVLATGHALVERATAQGLAFTLEDIDTIDLPEDNARVDRAQLRALASIYLAADLEPAGIIQSVQQLASLGGTGGLSVDPGGAGPLLEQWWRHRHERMSQDERSAFFARLFGTSSGPASAEAKSNQRFEGRMLDLCEALSGIDQSAGSENYATTLAQSRVRTAARALSQNLGDSSTGMVAFVAGEVIATLKEAFAILGHADLRRAFGATNIWGVIRAISRLGHVEFPDAQPYIRRGKAGMMLLSWLADSLPVVFGTGILVRRGHPVIGAAIDWLEATLVLGEGADGGSAVAGSWNNEGTGSVWSSLAH